MLIGQSITKRFICFGLGVIVGIATTKWMEAGAVVRQTQATVIMYVSCVLFTDAGHGKCFCFLCLFIVCRFVRILRVRVLKSRAMCRKWRKC